MRTVQNFLNPNLKRPLITTLWFFHLPWKIKIQFHWFSLHFKIIFLRKKLVRDDLELALAKEIVPAIILIDKFDAIGTKQFDCEKSGELGVQRTM